MQKVQSYLYPNRVIVIADLAGFTVENTVVYAKTVKIYKGVDNVIQFDVQNADQKRLDLVTTPLVTNLQMNLMDISGYSIGTYVVTPHPSVKGIGVTTIPAADLVSIQHQFLKYSLTATDTDNNNIPLYTDSRFSAVGKIEVVESAIPIDRPEIIYDKFQGEINYMGNVINHSSAVSTKLYEAIPTSELTFTVNCTNNFVATIYVEGTRDSTVSVESFRNAQKIQQQAISRGTTSLTFTVDVADFNYLRVSWTYPDVWQYSNTGQDPTVVYGAVTKILVNYGSQPH